MYLPKEKKEELFKTFGKDAKDSGSPASQVALFSSRITHLTGHLKKNKKDYVTQRSLIILVAKRRKMLNYLKSKDAEAYKKLIADLGLRK